MNDDEKLVTLLASEVGSRLFLVHHVPGRLHIKFDPSLAEHPDREQAEKLFPSLHSFEIRKINRWTKSVVIWYNVRVVPPELIDKLFVVSDPEDKENIVRQIKDSISRKAGRKQE
ncbi:MAG: hypothetical protein R6U55_16270 [Desulfovermiculus sp.]